MKKYIILLLAVVGLGACSEARLVSHLVKKIPMPMDLQKGNPHFKIGTPYVIKGKTYSPKESYTLVEKGIASWYGPGFHGKLTANGEVYNQYELTAAHRTLQMPSIIRVTNLENGRSLIMRVNDRGPYSRNRILDVSDRGAELLGFKNQGTARIKLEVLSDESRIVARAAKNGEDTSGMEVAFNNKSYPTEDVMKKIKPPRFDVSKLEPIQMETLKRSNDIIKTPIIPTKIFIQAGSFSVQENAVLLAGRLSSIGNSSVYPALVNKIKYYRVRIGPFDNIKIADLALNKLVDSGNAEAMIILEDM